MRSGSPKPVSRVMISQMLPGVGQSGPSTVKIMTAENLVDAALAELALGEKVTIPSLPDSLDREAYEIARLALGPNLSHRSPAARYVK